MSQIKDWTVSLGPLWNVKEMALLFRKLPVSTQDNGNIHYGKPFKMYLATACTYRTTQSWLPVAAMWPSLAFRSRATSVPACTWQPVSSGFLGWFSAMPASLDSWQISLGTQGTPSCLESVSWAPAIEAIIAASWAWTLDSQSWVSCSQGQQKGASVPSLT